MPVKNAGTYLKPCLESILSQTYRNWELIAINDHSTDSSAEVLMSYAHKYENIQTADSDDNGIVKALQKAYDLSKGKFIHRMDADDIMPLRKLEMLRNNWQLGAVVTGKVNYFTDEGVIGDGFNKYREWINNLMETNNLWKDPYLECSLPSPAWLMGRSDFERIGAFRSDLLPEDYDLMFRVYASKLKVKTVNETIHLWRDSTMRTSRIEPTYFPIAYYPLKVHYFLRIDRSKKPLVLWGAGKKGKIIAKLLIDQNVEFTWITDNKNKIGLSIYGIQMQSTADVDLLHYQTILAISSPKDKAIINEELSKLKSSEYFWFC